MVALHDNRAVILCQEVGVEVDSLASNTRQGSKIFFQELSRKLIHTTITQVVINE